MWELIVALLGGAWIATKVASDKAAIKSADKKFEDEQQRLKLFRESVTNEQTVSAVNDYMCMDGSRDKIAEELHELFQLVPELNGLEQYWICSNHRPPAGNWFFIELILCVKRGCVPLTKQFRFTINPYYIGQNLNGTPKYVAISNDSNQIIADWIVKKLQSYGVNIGLRYETPGWINQFVWHVPK